MTDVEAILTREELAALLEDVRANGTPERHTPAATQRPSPAWRALAGFADEQSRLASTVHQRPIRFTLLRAEPMPTAELRGFLTPRDRAFALRVAEAPGTGVMLIGRSVLFGWLAMAFGAPAELETSVPSRAFTRIELRLLRRIAGELVNQLSSALEETLPGRCEVGELLEPDMVDGFVSPRLLVASFDVAGLGEPGRLRLGLPEAWIDSLDQSLGSQALDEVISPAGLMEVPLELRAEAGRARLTLHELAGLKPGDVVRLDGASDGRVLVRIAGKPRFKAVLGSAGGQAALQITSE